jgi:hypothetical protein
MNTKILYICTLKLAASKLDIVISAQFVGLVETALSASNKSVLGGALIVLDVPGQVLPTPT